MYKLSEIDKQLLHDVDIKTVNNLQLEQFKFKVLNLYIYMYCTHAKILKGKVIKLHFYNRLLSNFRIKSWNRQMGIKPRTNNGFCQLCYCER